MGYSSSLAGRYARHRFTILFSVLLLTIAGHGFASILFPGAEPLVWLLGMSLVAVVFSARRRAVRWLLGGLMVVCVAARLMQGLLDHPAPVFVTQALLVIICLLAAGVAMRHALGAGRVDIERICSALDVYLLAGIAFGVGYWLMETVLPGSVSAAFAGSLAPAHAIYFSFVIQSTLGFGDIVPIAEHAQGIVVIQAVGGQMYLAVLVARLVSLFSAHDGP